MSGSDESLGLSQHGQHYAAITAAKIALRLGKLDQRHDALVEIAGKLTMAGDKVIGAIEALAVESHGGPRVDWSAVDASQDRMREAVRAFRLFLETVE